MAIIAPFVFLVVFKMPAKTGMFYSAIIVIILAFFVWDMNVLTISASMLEGIHIALTILLILFGAIVLLNTLQNTGAVDRINQGFCNISADLVVHIVVDVILFGELIDITVGDVTR